MASNLQFVEVEKIKAAIADVRNDSSETDWCLVAFQEGTQNQMELKGSGSQGVEELKGQLVETNCFFGLIRTKEMVDEAETIKFVFFQYLGGKLKPMFKAKISTYQGKIEDLFKPFHVKYFSSDVAEIKQEEILKVVNSTSMVKSGESQSSNAEKKSVKNLTQDIKKNESKPPTTFEKKAVEKKPFIGGIKFEDHEAIKSKVAEVHNEKSETTWVLICNNDKDELKLLDSGTGLVDEVKEKLDDAKVIYGMYRVKEMIDECETIKFVFFYWIGPNVKVMIKAKVSMKIKEIEQIFSPFHVSNFVSTRDDVSDEIFRKIVGKASMSISSEIKK